jgi:CheY-like chemotaxis protein
MNADPIVNPSEGDAQFKRVPVVMLTSSRQEADLAQSYELGVNAYVVKPVDFPQFNAAVKQAGAFWAILNEVPPHRTEYRI